MKYMLQKLNWWKKFHMMRPLYIRLEKCVWNYTCYVQTNVFEKTLKYIEIHKEFGMVSMGSQVDHVLLSVQYNLLETIQYPLNKCSNIKLSLLHYMRNIWIIIIHTALDIWISVNTYHLQPCSLQHKFQICLRELIPVTFKYVLTLRLSCGCRWLHGHRYIKLYIHGEAPLLVEWRWILICV